MVEPENLDAWLEANPLPEDPSMTPTRYKAAIKALELSQERAGDWLGIGRRTSQGYALGEYPVPEPIAKLLRLCVKLKLKPEDVK
jgi:hypothetical protein